MPQMHLPFFPEGVTEINPRVAFKKEDGWVTYFNGSMPIFRHAEGDIASFKGIVSQFYIMGVAKQAEIVKAFGVNALMVKRAVKLYREKGLPSFFEPKGRRGPGVLTPPVLESAQHLLNEGKTPSDVARELNLKADTVRKAIFHGRLHRPGGGARRGREAMSKSERSAEDQDAGMG